MKYDLCVKYVSRLRNLRSFTPIWVTGSTSVKKDSAKKHVNGEAHLMAVDLDMKEIEIFTEFCSEMNNFDSALSLSDICLAAL